MTRAEYLEFVEETLAFKRKPWDVGEWKPLVSSGEAFPDPGMQLRETEEITEALRKAHRKYCGEVESILFPERAAEIDVIAAQATSIEEQNAGR